MKLIFRRVIVFPFVLMACVLGLPFAWAMGDKGYEDHVNELLLEVWG